MGTDHMSFLPHGVPAFAVVQDEAEYRKTHHTESDTVDKVYPDEVNQGAKVLAAWAYNVAMLPEILPRDLKPSQMECSTAPNFRQRRDQKPKSEEPKQEKTKAPACGRRSWSLHSSRESLVHSLRSSFHEEPVHAQLPFQTAVFLSFSGLARSPLPTITRSTRCIRASAFKIQHMGLSYVHGRFNDVSGGFTVDTADPAKTSFKLEYQVAERGHQQSRTRRPSRSPDFFNAKQYASVNFKSTAVKPVDGGYEVSGRPEPSRHDQADHIHARREARPREIPEGVTQTGFFDGLRGQANRLRRRQGNGHAGRGCRRFHRIRRCQEEVTAPD